MSGNNNRKNRRRDDPNSNVAGRSDNRPRGGTNERSGNAENVDRRNANHQQLLELERQQQRLQNQLAQHHEQLQNNLHQERVRFFGPLPFPGSLPIQSTSTSPSASISTVAVRQTSASQDIQFVRPNSERRNASHPATDQRSQSLTTNLLRYRSRNFDNYTPIPMPEDIYGKKPPRTSSTDMVPRNFGSDENDKLKLSAEGINEQDTSFNNVFGQGVLRLASSLVSLVTQERGVSIPEANLLLEREVATSKRPNAAMYIDKSKLSPMTTIVLSPFDTPAILSNPNSPLATRSERRPLYSTATMRNASVRSESAMQYMPPSRMEPPDDVQADEQPVKSLTQQALESLGLLHLPPEYGAKVAKTIRAQSLETPGAKSPQLDFLINENIGGTQTTPPSAVASLQPQFEVNQTEPTAYQDEAANVVVVPYPQDTDRIQAIPTSAIIPHQVIHQQQYVGVTTNNFNLGTSMNSSNYAGHPQHDNSNINQRLPMVGQFQPSSPLNIQNTPHVDATPMQMSELWHQQRGNPTCNTPFPISHPPIQSSQRQLEPHSNPIPIPSNQSRGFQPERPPTIGSHIPNAAENMAMMQQSIDSQFRMQMPPTVHTFQPLHSNIGQLINPNVRPLTPQGNPPISTGLPPTYTSGSQIYQSNSPHPNQQMQPNAFQQYLQNYPALNQQQPNNSPQNQSNVYPNNLQTGFVQRLTYIPQPPPMQHHPMPITQPPGQIPPPTAATGAIPRDTRNQRLSNDPRNSPLLYHQNYRQSPRHTAPPNSPQHFPSNYRQNNPRQNSPHNSPQNLRQNPRQNYTQNSPHNSPQTNRPNPRLHNPHNSQMNRQNPRLPTHQHRPQNSPLNSPQHHRQNAPQIPPQNSPQPAPRNPPQSAPPNPPQPAPPNPPQNEPQGVQSSVQNPTTSDAGHGEQASGWNWARIANSKQTNVVPETQATVTATTSPKTPTASPTKQPQKYAQGVSPVKKSPNQNEWKVATTKRGNRRRGKKFDNNSNQRRRGRGRGGGGGGGGQGAQNSRRYDQRDGHANENYQRSYNTKSDSWVDKGSKRLDQSTLHSSLTLKPISPPMERSVSDSKLAIKSFDTLKRAAYSPRTRNDLSRDQNVLFSANTWICVKQLILKKDDKADNVSGEFNRSDTSQEKSSTVEHDKTVDSEKRENIPTEQTTDIIGPNILIENWINDVHIAQNETPDSEESSDVSPSLEIRPITSDMTTSLPTLVGIAVQMPIASAKTSKCFLRKISAANNYKIKKNNQSKKPCPISSLSNAFKNSTKFQKLQHEYNAFHGEKYESLPCERLVDNTPATNLTHSYQIQPELIEHSYQYNPIPPQLNSLYDTYNPLTFQHPPPQAYFVPNTPVYSNELPTGYTSLGFQFPDVTRPPPCIYQYDNIPTIIQEVNHYQMNDPRMAGGESRPCRPQYWEEDQHYRQSGYLEQTVQYPVQHYEFVPDTDRNEGNYTYPNNGIPFQFNEMDYPYPKDYTEDYQDANLQPPVRYPLYWGAHRSGMDCKGVPYTCERGETFYHHDVDENYEISAGPPFSPFIHESSIWADSRNYASEQDGWPQQVFEPYETEANSREDTTKWSYNQPNSDVDYRPSNKEWTWVCPNNDMVSYAPPDVTYSQEPYPQQEVFATAEEAWCHYEMNQFPCNMEATKKKNRHLRPEFQIPGNSPVSWSTVSTHSTERIWGRSSTGQVTHSSLDSGVLTVSSGDVVEFVPRRPPTSKGRTQGDLNGPLTQVSFDYSGTVSQIPYQEHSKPIILDSGPHGMVTTIGTCRDETLYYPY